MTRPLALAACGAGIDDVEVAFALGAAGRDLSGRALYTRVRETTHAESDAFVAEAYIPRPSADNASQNWEAAALEELWESPIVGSTGTSVGKAVCEALEPGEELPSRLECLGHGIVGALDLPELPRLRKWLSRKACQAYHHGFLDSLMSDPRACVFDVVHAGEPGHRPLMTVP